MNTTRFLHHKTEENNKIWYGDIGFLIEKNLYSTPRSSSYVYRFCGCGTLCEKIHDFGSHLGFLDIRYIFKINIWISMTCPHSSFRIKAAFHHILDGPITISWITQFSGGGNIRCFFVFYDIFIGTMLYQFKLQARDIFDLAFNLNIFNFQHFLPTILPQKWFPW